MAAMDVISFGSVYLELVFGHVAALPQPGQEIFANDFAISCGGAVTSATAAARSGARAGVCTRLGDDLGGRVVAEHCEREAVDLSASVRVPGRATGITMVLNYDGDRSFVTYVPPVPKAEQPELAHWIEVLRDRKPAWCYVHAGPGVAEFLRAARAQGTRVALDVALNTISAATPAVLECIPLADVFTPNRAELLQLTGAGSVEGAVGIASGWSTPTVVKMGAAGALVIGPDGVASVADGVTSVDVADLTGAGDSFAGAMIGSLLRGAPLIAAVVAANGAGSAAAGRLGAVGPVQVDGLSAVPDGLATVMHEGLNAVMARDLNRDQGQVKLTGTS
jgi:sugar/nucleoside kinase (ribokinase family)